MTCPGLRGAIRRFVKAIRLLRVADYRAAALHGVAAAIEHEAILRELRRTLHPRLVIDVGANVGQFSVAVRHCIPDARIIAFEPLEPAASRFARLFAGQPGVGLHKCAIGPLRARQSMHVSKAADSSSLLAIGDNQTRVFPGTGESHREWVDVAPLSDFITAADMPQPVLLKIDTQGYELKVLAAAEAVLPHISAVYVECAFIPFYQGQPLAHEVIDWLHVRGYRLRYVHAAARDPRGLTVQADLLFTSVGD